MQENNKNSDSGRNKINEAIERDNEIENVHTTTKILDKLINSIKTNISTIFFTQPTNEQSEKIKEIIM
uniref:Uncharacterized protein n=1 Tax=Meloidogyne hapla TaxID=6305 RepID=A0A1I8BLM0_MELHA